MEEIAARLAHVRSRIASACERAERDPAGVTLVAVTKTHAPALIVEAYAAGQRDFGENRVQEAGRKIDELRASGIAPVWHLLGHLQSNKVGAALRLFDILHGVDSARIAAAINARSQRPVRVFLEVNVAGEATKQGVRPDEAPGVAEAIGRLPNVELIGLMTVAPMVDDPEDVRPVFRTLRELRDAIGLRELSMGMTDDFEVAIEEGATFVRVGRAIFGPREG
jgi:pyridoxal phosphate enzyme (YggS family)